MSQRERERERERVYVVVVHFHHIYVHVSGRGEERVVAKIEIPLTASAQSKFVLTNVANRISILIATQRLIKGSTKQDPSFLSSYSTFPLLSKFNRSRLRNRLFAYFSTDKREIYDLFEFSRRKRNDKLNPNLNRTRWKNNRTSLTKLAFSFIFS